MSYYDDAWQEAIASGEVDLEFVENREGDEGSGDDEYEEEDGDGGRVKNHSSSPDNNKQGGGMKATLHRWGSHSSSSA